MTDNNEQQQEDTMKAQNFIYKPQVDLETLERGYILEAIRHHGGNKIKAASSLGVTVKTIYNKFKAWGGLELFPEFHSTKGRPRKEGE